MTSGGVLRVAFPGDISEELHGAAAEAGVPVAVLAARYVRQGLATDTPFAPEDTKRIGRALSLMPFLGGMANNIWNISTVDELVGTLDEIARLLVMHAEADRVAAGQHHRLDKGMRGLAEFLDVLRDLREVP